MVASRAVVALLAAAAAFATVRPASANTLPGKPGLYTVKKKDASRIVGAELPVVTTTIDAIARGPLIEVVVHQRFTNPGKHAIEAVYIFPLADDAAVSAMAITTGNRTITAQIAPRDQARARHEAAVKAGAVGGLLEQERPDVFTQTVTGIAPGATIDVELRWDTIASRIDDQWQLVVPLVVAPRYVPGKATGMWVTGSGRAKDTDRAKDASRVTPQTRADRGGVPVTFSLVLDRDARRAGSPSHDAKVEQAAGGTRITVVDDIGDRDLIVRWTSASRARAWLERDAAEGFVALTVEAPRSRGKRKPVRLVLAIDRSSSMSGEAAVAVGRATHELIGALGRGDRYASADDGGTYRWRAGGRGRTIGDGVGAARSDPDLVALVAGARAAFAGAGGAVQVVLIGDGLVADDAAVVAAARGLGVPVHVVGVGPAPNRSLLRAIAATTGGTLRFATDGDVAVAAALARAVIADAGTAGTPPAIDWGGIEVTDVVPASLPRLGAGQAITIFGRTAKTTTTRANGRVAGDGFAIEVAPRTPAIAGATTPRGLIARLWGRTRIGELIAGRATAAEIMRVAIGFGLVSPHTAMIAVGSDTVVAGGTTRSTAVPVALPAGMRWQAVFGKAGDASQDARDADNRQRAAELERARREYDQQIKGGVTRGGGGGGGGGDAPVSEPDRNVPVGGAADSPPDEDDANSEDEEYRDGVKPSPPASISASGSYSAGSVADSESVAFARHGRARGLALALRAGGGVVFGDQSRGLGLIGARLGATLGRIEFGLDGSLWVVGSETDTVGRALVSTSVIGLASGWLDVVLGAGLHVAGDVGIGYGGGIRVGPGRLGGFLRLDGAIIGTGDERRSDAAVNLGVEASF